MREPLLWNTLAEAAEWLTEATGDTWTERRVLDAVARRHKPGDGTTPTFIKAAPPPDTKFGVFDLHDNLRWSDDWRLIPLWSNDLRQLLAGGWVEKELIDDKYPGSDENERLQNARLTWVLPKGSSLRVTPTMCGINAADLMALRDSLGGHSIPPNDTPSSSPRPDADSASRPPLAGADVAPSTGADAPESAPPSASLRADKSMPAASPATLPSPVIAAAFDGLNGWGREKWAKYLGDPPKWLEKARSRKGAQGAGDAATWNPVTIAVALLDKSTPISKLDAVFKLRSVKAWSDEWDERRELLRD